MRLAPRLRCRELRRESLESRQLLAVDLSVPIDTPACVAEPDTSQARFDRPLPTTAKAAEAQAGGQLRMVVRETYLPGKPVLVRVQVEDPQGDVDRSRWDATVTLTTDRPEITLSQTKVRLVNGRGSALIAISGNSPFQLTATLDELVDRRELEPIRQLEIPRLWGVLPGEATRLNGVVQVVGDLTVPPNHVLTIEPGTLILMDGVPQTPEVQLGTRILVEGTLVALGTEDQPISFTATDPDRPWGEIEIKGGTVSLDYTDLTRAGNSPRGGHTNTGPAIRLRSDGRLRLSHSSVTDISGKILQASSGDLTILDSLLSRAVMGPEIEDTSLDLEDSWIIEMAGVYHHHGTVDDNDGIYLHEQQDGQSITLRRSVIADVQDDGIDTLGSIVSLDDVIVREVVDKAMSVFNGVVSVRRGLLVEAEIGIEAKGSGSSTADVHLDRTTIANVQSGVRAHDKGSPDPNVRITYDIVNSIIHVRPGGDPLLTDYDPADLHVNYSWLEEDWMHPGSGQGNVSGFPLFVDAVAHDYRLAAGSPAIDAGDPNAGVDPNGTPVDLGYFDFASSSNPVGDLNGDGQVDASDIDSLCAALADGTSDPRFDLDQNEVVDSADVDYLIGEVLQTTRGDANLDGVFDSGDLVLIFQAGEYEDGIVGNSGWATGDWDCDGEFSTSDLVAAFEAGGYLEG